MKNEVRVSQALADQEAMDRPRPTMNTITFSVHAPTALVDAFKASCRIRGEKHPIIVRRLLAKYVQQAATDETKSHQPGSVQANPVSGFQSNVSSGHDIH